MFGDNTEVGGGIDAVNNSSLSQHDVKLDYKICKLENDNYVTWKWQIINILKAKQLYKADDMDDEDDMADKQALALLGSALNNDNMALVVGCETAFEVWKRLELIFENKTTFEKQELLGKLHSYKIESSTDLAKSLMELQTTVSKLKLLGETVSDDSLMSIIINALPTMFENFIVAFKLLSPSERTLNHLISNVIAHSRSIKREPEAIAMVAKSSVNPVGDQTSTCNYCKKPGHWVRDCIKLKNKKKREQNPPVPAENLVSFMAIASVFSSSKSVWVSDSGSSHHMTPNKQWFFDYSPFNCSNWER